MAQCRNCSAPLAGPYCHECGQKEADLARPFVSLAGDLLRETFDLDGRAWRTVRALFLNPGLLTTEFLAGKRRTYTPPLRLYLFISVVFFVLMAWFASRGYLLDQEQSLDTDAALQSQFLSERLPRLMFILLPAFALLMKAVFPSRLYFDHLIFAVHLHSAAYVVFALMLPFEGVAGQNLAALIVQVIALIYLVTYLLLAIRRVYGTSWLGTTGRTIAVLFAYMVIVSGSIEATSNFLIISD